MKNLILQENSTFEQAVQMLDKNGNGFLAVTDNNGVLLGILTDGDIRRAILQKETRLEKIINRNPVSISSKVSKKQAISYLKSIHRRHLPVIDENNRLVDIIILDDLKFNLKSNTVVIMAGGLGSRLGDLTKEVPKPMLKLGGKPMLELLVNSFVEKGFCNLVISVNYKAEIIKNYFGDGSDFGATITFVEERKRLGTAGALSLMKEPNTPFFVINGDILTSIDFEEVLRFHIENQSVATMCVKKFQQQVAYATIEAEENKLISISEKPSFDFLINSGIYLLNPEVLRYVPENEYFDMPSLFQTLLEKQYEVNVFETDDFWMDIGQLKDYKSASEIFRTS